MTEPTMTPREQAVRWLDEHAFTDGDSGSCSLIIDKLEAEFESVEQAARDDEREGCAKTCEIRRFPILDTERSMAYHKAQDDCAKAIRARKEEGR